MKKTSVPIEFYKPETLRSRDSVAYLMLRNKSLYQRLGDVKLALLGITAAQMSLLMMISYSDESTVSSLSHELGINPSATVRIVQKLVRMKLIKKIVSKNDGRVLQLILTTEGKRVRESIPPIWCGLLNQSLNGFTFKEFEQFKKFLLRVEKNNLLQMGNLK
jgi:MarR family transcriptional regulator, multiple antibiotic resistance protein MarR